MTAASESYDWTDPGKDLRELIPRFYDDLHQMAHWYLTREWRDFSLGSVSLIHETWFRLEKQQVPSWRNRKHFFGIASKLMRRCIADYARSRLRSKRSGLKVCLDEESALFPDARDEELLGLEDAMKDLERSRPDLAAIVDLRFWSGFDRQTIARLLDVSVSTVDRRWGQAKDLLYATLDRRGAE